MIKLETERLIIRDHHEGDLESHHRLLSNGEIMYYIEDIQTHSLEESKANLQQAIDEDSNPNRKFYFLRIDTKEGEHVGEIGYTVLEFTPVGKSVELGYFINREHWGKGYVTEAVEELLRFAFRENDVYRITTGCFKENIASEKIMIKCGMTKEGEYKEKQWLEGKMRDRVSYRLLRDEWLERNK